MLLFQKSNILKSDGLSGQSSMKDFYRLPIIVIKKLYP